MSVEMVVSCRKVSIQDSKESLRLYVNVKPLLQEGHADTDHFSRDTNGESFGYHVFFLPLPVFSQVEDLSDSCKGTPNIHGNTRH